MIGKHRGQTSENANQARDLARTEGAQRAAALDALVHRAQALEVEAHKLHEQAQLARGTREIPTRRAGDVPVALEQAPIAPSTVSPLYREAEALLNDKPHTFRELCTALKIPPAGENSLKSVLVRLQRDGRPMVNLGNGARAIWWIDVHDRIGQIAAGRRVVSARR